MKGKIKSLKSILGIVNALRKKGKIIGFTNGVFDILHPGHIDYLEKAKKCVDILILGLNSDNSVKAIKGRSRPINTQWHRASVLAGLEAIDYIVIFEDKTPYELIRRLKPDYLFKGADWRSKEIVGKNFVRSYGGKVIILPYLKGYSTTKLLKKIWRMKFTAS